MEMAKRKDGAMNVWSHVAKCASLFLPKSKNGQEPTMTINFVLLQSPLLDLHDPDAIANAITVNREPDLNVARLQ
jgi:hypothetical protein